MTSTQTYRPYPGTRRVVRDALSHYAHGLTMTELRRRCSRAGLVHAIGEDRRNVNDEFDAVLEYLIDEDLVAQRVIAGGVRYVDAVTYPTTTDQNGSTTP